MACAVRAERNSFFPIYLRPLGRLGPLVLPQLPLAGSHPHRSLGRFKHYWLGVWVLVPAGWVQILALPLRSLATLDRSLNLWAP